MQSRASRQWCCNALAQPRIFYPCPVTAAAPGVRQDPRSSRRRTSDDHHRCCLRAYRGFSDWSAWRACLDWNSPRFVIVSAGIIVPALKSPEIQRRSDSARSLVPILASDLRLHEASLPANVARLMFWLRLACDHFLYARHTRRSEGVNNRVVDLLAVTKERKESIERLALSSARALCRSVHPHQCGRRRWAQSSACAILAARGMKVSIVNPTPWPDTYEFLLGDDVTDATAGGAAAMRKATCSSFSTSAT